MKAQKAGIITFKADDALAAALRGLPNRSEFIRGAVLSALANACPLCRGTGVFTPDQKKHWDTFAEAHAVAECDDCHAVHLVCRKSRAKREHRKGR